jgi:hypothetical protein
MTSKLIFSNIKSRTTKTEVSPTERKYGRLQARTTISQMAHGLVLDVLLLSEEAALVDNERLEIDDAIMRGRKTFTRGDFTDLYIEKGWATVRTDFFKEFLEGDVIEVILHEER